MPQNVVKLIKHKRNISAWITHGIVRSIQYRDNMYKKHKMTNPHSPEFDIHKINLKTYNSILNKSIRLAKKSYYELLLKKIKDNIRGTWKTINGFLNKIKRKKSVSHNK